MNEIGIGLSVILLVVFAIMALIMGISEAIGTVVDGAKFLFIGLINGVVGVLEFLLEHLLG